MTFQTNIWNYKTCAILSLCLSDERQTERTYMFLFCLFQLLHVTFSMIQCFSLFCKIKTCLSFWYHEIIMLPFYPLITPSPNQSDLNTQIILCDIKLLENFNKHIWHTYTLSLKYISSSHTRIYIQWIKVLITILIFLEGSIFSNPKI